MTANASGEKEKGSESETVQAECAEPGNTEEQDPETSLFGVHSTGVTVEDLEVAFEDLIVGYAKVLGPGVRVRVVISTGTTKQDNLSETLVDVVLRVGKKKKKIAEDNTLGTALKRMLNADGSKWTAMQRKKKRR